ncbi:MAG: 4Fe-4S dicluster domain-containing protein [Coriobacteriales bacterium]|jgi:anaerobic dimethyl sulfoxide reductase subunit B (iron-sulfur subunit)|nr:4Fe-4S dicluster domain-containing protein [Coriobacteriales bacterium]
MTQHETTQHEVTQHETTQHAFFFDESRCIDCRACSFACRDWHDIKPGPVKFLRRFTWEEGAFPEVTMHTLFAPCYHCEKPACLKVCPNGAIWKEGRFGTVLVDEEKCQGCRNCWDACPYGAPQFASDVANGDSSVAKMSKCTMCSDRLKQGHMPTCVNACPSRALDFGPIEEMKSRYGDLQALRGMPDPAITKPAITFKPLAPKRQVVPYDAERARQLFGQRGDKLTPLYTDNAAVTDIEPGTVGKDRLDLKSPDSERALAATRSDEW